MGAGGRALYSIITVSDVFDLAAVSNNLCIERTCEHLVHRSPTGKENKTVSVKRRMRVQCWVFISRHLLFIHLFIHSFIYLFICLFFAIHQTLSLRATH